MKKYLFVIIVALLCIKGLQAQTNVSGNIAVNTTWTLANSPYIIVDTVVVLPGVTLTIQPGVVVKFNNGKRIEIRKARIKAIGTAIDSITFTSNDSLPVMGIYAGIYLHADSAVNYTDKFSYCNFKYADVAIIKTRFDTLIVSHSNFEFNNSGSATGNDWLHPALNIQIDSSRFKNNNYGIGSNLGLIKKSVIRYCNFSMNQTGIYVGGFNKIFGCTINSGQIGINNFGNKDTVVNCVIDSNSISGVSGSLQPYYISNCQLNYNGTGIDDEASPDLCGSKILNCEIQYNSIGIYCRNQKDTIKCNFVCNNSTYAFHCDYDYSSMFYLIIGDISHNYWCTSDSLSTTATFYGYDGTNFFFMPIDTIGCSLGISLGVRGKTEEDTDLKLSPNPFTSQTTLAFSTDQKSTTVKIIDVLGKEIRTITFSGKEIIIEKGEMERGIYFVEITDVNKNRVNRKIVVE